MIGARAIPDAATVARHYDELDPFYRAVWGENLHHGLWLTGDETPDQAVRNLTALVAEGAAVGPGSAVCDVGCGYGGTARFLAHRHGCRVVGLTLSPAQHRHATRTVGADGEAASGDANPSFLLADWLDVAFDTVSFDAVIAVESLSHMADKRAAIRKAREALRPGGRLVLAVWTAAPTPRRWERRHLLGPICDEGRLPGLATRTEYLAWIEEAGLELTDAKDLSEGVRRTWGVCLRRILGLAARSREARRYIRSRSSSERRFALTVGRMWLAYRTGALRYGWLVARAPGS